MIQEVKKNKIRVLVVDDSLVIRELICSIINATQDMIVVGTATNGEEALKAVITKKPDVITMDIHMPKLGGLAAIRNIMATQPVPIVIVSTTVSSNEAIEIYHVLEAGAVSVVGSLVGPHHSEHGLKAKELIETLKAMAEIKVVKRWPIKNVSIQPEHLSLSGNSGSNQEAIKLIVIGASTGGPIVLKNILSHIPNNFPISILIVQHITTGFTEGLVNWLKQSTGFAIKIAETGDLLKPGCAYLAPEEAHMEVTKNGTIVLTQKPPVNGHRPSVGVLFRSVAERFGSKSVGILLTGMGKDGAAELKLMKDQGALTIVQDKKTAVVNGMPGEAVKLEAASLVLSPEAIATLLSKIAEQITQRGKIYGE